MHFYYDGARNPKAWIKVGSLYQAADDIYVRLHDDGDMHYTWHFLPGFRTDGGSIPAAFRWFVPSWSEDNEIINVAYFTHDAAYTSGLVHRSIADDMLKCILIASGMSEFKASVVHWCVDKFAASHYGQQNDSTGSSPFVNLKVYV